MRVAAAPGGVDGLAGQHDRGAARPVGGTAGMARLRNHVTAVKTRFLAGGVHSAKQQVVRIDRAGTPPSGVVTRRVEHTLARAVRLADVIVLSDYGTGLITPDRWSRVRSSVRRRREPFVFVDSRYALAGYDGMTACTPNESEVEALLGLRIGDDRGMLEDAGRELLRSLGCRAVLITRGSRGMALFEAGRRPVHIPIVGTDEVADVTGAGDTVIATFALAVGAGASFQDAARLANHAGGCVVMKRGTATVTARELAAAL